MIHPKQRFSVFSLLRNALGYRTDWQRMWRSPEPKRRYDAVIIGGGGHGLGVACYLAKDHGIRNVAVIEKGWLGGGNTARNTMTIRSNFIRPPSVLFHEGSMALYRELSRELNYNLMVTRRGMISFLQSSQAARTAARMANTMHVYGTKYELIDVEEIKRRLPIFRPPPRPRLEVLGGVYQHEAMMARHDAVAWGFARMADAHGVDIIQNCEVTGIRRDGGRVTGVETTRGVIEAGKVGTARHLPRHRAVHFGGARDVPDLHPHEAPAALGGHARHCLRRFSDHLQDTAPRLLRRHRRCRRLQDHPHGSADARVADREG